MKIKAGIALLFILLASVSCGTDRDRRGVDLKVDLLPEVITDFLYVKMNYNFSFKDKFAGLDKDYTVFVHFWRPKNKEMLLVDDHLPQVSSSQWKKGDTITYSRRIFIPKFLEESDIDFEGYEEIKMTVGLYDPTSGNDGEKTVLFQKNIEIRPASYSAPEIVFSEGWNSVETDMNIENPDWRKWQWTTKRAVCIIENPKKEAHLIIRGGVDKIKSKDQKVIFKINDTILDEFVPETAKFSKEYTIKPEIMGKEYEFRFAIETDKVFVPAVLNPNSTDKRELGVQIYFLYFRELVN